MSEPYLPADTSLDAIRVQHAIFRRMSPEDRLRNVFRMTEFARELSASGVRSRHPEYSPRQVHLAVIRFVLGDELFRIAGPTGGDSPMTQAEVLLSIAAHLEAAGIPFMVVGSYSSSLHSQPRTTNDADVVIDPTPAQLDGFLSGLGADFYFSPEAAHEALARRDMFNVIELSGGWKVDLIVRKDRPFSAEEFARRQLRPLAGRTLPVASPEDVILSKLEWNRITPSERQLRDAVGVAVVQWATLDRAYLSRWAAVLGVGVTLAELLQAAEQQQPQ
jgi:hypothetical protein